MKNIIIWSNENQQEQKGPWDSWPTELTPYHRYIDAILEKTENGDYNTSQHLSADENLIGALVRQLASQKWWKKTYDPRQIEKGDIVSTVKESFVRDDDGNLYKWERGNRLRVQYLLSGSLSGSLGVLPVSDKLYLLTDDGSKVVFTAEEFLEKFCSERGYAVISSNTVELTERANPVDGPTNLEVFKEKYLDPAPNELQSIFKKMADWFVKGELYEDSFSELVYSAPFLKWSDQYGDKNFIDPEYDLNLNDPDLTIKSVYKWATALGKAGLDPKENKIQWDSKPTWVNSGEDANQDTITVLDLDDWDEIEKHGSAMEHCYAVEDSPFVERYKNLLERPDVKYLAIRSKTGRSKGGVFIGIKGPIDEEHPFGSEVFPIEAKSGGRSGQQPLDFRHPKNPTYIALNNFYSFLKEKGVSVDEKIVNVGYAYENRMFPIQDEDHEPEHLEDLDDDDNYYDDIEVHSLDDLDYFFFSLKNDSQWFGWDEDPQIQYAANGDYWYISAKPVRVKVDPLAVCNELYAVIAEKDIKDYPNQDFFMLQLATLIAACEYANQSSLDEYPQAKVIIESLIRSLQHDFPDSPGIQVTMTNAREYVEDNVVTEYEYQGGKPLLRSIMRYKTYVKPLPEQAIEDDTQGNSRFFDPDTQNDQGTFFYPQGTPTKQAEEEKSWNQALERFNGDPEQIYKAIQAFPNIMQSAGFASYAEQANDLILVALNLAAKQGLDISVDQYNNWANNQYNFNRRNLPIENWENPPRTPLFNQQQEYQQNRQNMVNANTIKIWEKDSALKDLPQEDAEKIIAAIKDAMAKNDFDKIQLLKSLVDRLTVQHGGQIEVTAAMQRASDYFYDWQGYSPDDGSLDDGVVKPSGPAPAYVNMPSRSCPKCNGDGQLPPGHMINFDEYDKLNAKFKVNLGCPNCGYNWPMEYDKLMGGGERWHVANKTIEARGPHKPKQFTQTAPTVQGPEGKPYVVVYRGMSDKEYKEWVSGDPINTGKYFTSMPHKFFVDPNIIKQTDEHTYTFVNTGILQGEYIKPIAPSAFVQPAAPKIENQMFAHTNQKENFNQGMQMESSYIDLDVRAKVVNANLKEFPNYYDRIASFKKMAEDPDKFSEVDLQSPPYGGSQPYLNKDMPNPMGPAIIDIQKKRKPDHKPVIIEPEIVDIKILEKAASITEAPYITEAPIPTGFADDETLYPEDILNTPQNTPEKNQDPSWLEMQECAKNLEIDINKDPIEELPTLLSLVYSNVRTAKIGKDSGESDLVGRPRDFAELPTKANYTYDDPFDMAGKKQFIESIYVDWFSRITPQTLELVEKKEFDKLQNSLDYLYVREVVSNALRLSILSTNKELGLNSQQYQALLQIPPTESNIDVFHETFQKAKKLWSNFKEKNWHNWNDMYLNEHAERISQIAGVIDEATYYAIIEMKEGGAGTTWRSNAIALVKGIGPKTASFAWLLLSPLLSELATLDTWMLSYFYNDEKEEKPLDVRVLENYIVQRGENKGQERLGYAEIENRVRSVRDALYPDEKLGVLQWGLWDYLRSKGWHQNHDALRVVVPVAYELIWWHGHRRSFKSQMINPKQIDQAKQILDKNNDAKDIYCPYCGSKARVGQNPGEYICINREVGAENHVFTSDQQIFCPVRINNKVQCNNPAYSLGNNEYRCLPQKNNKEYTNPNYHVFTDKDFYS